VGGDVMVLRCLSILLVAWLLTPMLAADEPELKPFSVGTFAFAKGEGKQGYVPQLVKKALAQQGYSMGLQYFPGRRLIAQLNTGLIDADLGRSLNMAKAFENVVRVEEPLFRPCALLYRLQSHTLADVKGLEASTKIGALAGGPEGRSILREHWPRADLVPFKSFKQAAAMLMAGRIDLVALPGIMISRFMAEVGRPVALQDSFYLGPVYMHVHKRHAELAVRLSATIKRLKRQYPSPECRLETSRLKG